MTEDRFGIVGKLIARTYEIRDVVAEGGFGVVYRAYHQGFRAEVALKCLKIPTELTKDQRLSFLEQFRGEAEVLFRLSAHNSHIVRPLHVDAFQTKDGVLVPFMALEWLEGRTLDGLMEQRLEKGREPISLVKLVRLLTPVAEALEQAHNLPGKDGPQMVVHRDMKPENLFIARVGDTDVAKVLDFGISKVKSTAGEMAGRASLNKDALVAFSPAYGAPEQWAPRRFGQTGRWTDVWGLALTVVEAAKGVEVVTGDQAAMMGTILDPGRRPTPRTEGIQVSDAVEGVFEKALAVDPVQRYQSVGAYWDDLTQALGVQQEVGVVSIHQSRKRVVRDSTTGFDSLRPPSAPANSSEQGVGVPRVRAPVASVHEAQTERAKRPLSLGGQPSRAAVRQASSSHQPPEAGYSYGADVNRSRQKPVRTSSIYAPQGRSVWRALSPALSLIALSIAFTFLDRAFAHSRGIPLAFGPIQASWIAGGLMVVALVTGIIALAGEMEE